MQILGIELKRPGFWQATQALAVAVGLWALLTASPLGASSAVDAGANLVALVVGFMSPVLGIDVRKGARHFALNIGCCVVLVITYMAVAALLVS
jgi:hypothetical protein